MPKLSKKGELMSESPIRKLVPFAQKAVSNGVKVYHLNIGQPDIETPEISLKAIHDFNGKIVEYTHSAGNESYRKGLAKYYQKLEIDVDFTDILITTGGSEAITFAFLSTLNPNDEVIVPEPFYANYNSFTLIAGVKLTPITAVIENGFALPPIEEFEKLITKNTKGILICNPGNPTGYLYTQDEMNKLSEIVKKHDLYLYSDEVYREFCYDGLQHISAMSLKGIESNVIMIDSVSKRYSSCGTRIGALVTKNKDVINTALKFAQARLSPPSFGQIAGEAALNTPPEYFTKVKEKYTKRRNFLVEELNKIKGVICPMPKGAFYVIAKLPIDNNEKFCQWMLSDFEYKKQTVMMAPASGFYSSPDKGVDEVRIAYVLKKEDLANAVEVLKEGLNKYPGKTI